MFKRLNVLMLATAVSLGAVSLGAVALAPVEAAAAQVVTEEVAATRAFPFLDKYLAVPAAERNEISVAYILKIKGGTQGSSIVLKHNGQSQKLNIQGDGRISPLPTLAQLRGGAKVEVTGPSKGVAMRVRVYATERPAQTMAAAPLIKAVNQSNSVMRKVGGALAFALPKPDRLYFANAGNGRVIMADGSQKVLPKTPRADVYPAGTPYFVPADHPGARSLSFDRTPSRIGIDDRVK